MDDCAKAAMEMMMMMERRLKWRWSSCQKRLGKGYREQVGEFMLCPMIGSRRAFAVEVTAQPSRRTDTEVYASFAYSRLGRSFLNKEAEPPLLQ
jgi:hypothetical protein